MKVLGISTSPRPKSNSDRLLREALAGAESAGAHIEYLRLSDYVVGPCIECNACYHAGVCAVEDDYQGILEKMVETDRLVFATPIFFMTVCAQAKALIDRGQCLWARKYVVQKRLFSQERDRRAMVIAVGGSKGTRQFESVRLTMRAYFDPLEMKYMFNLFVNKVDDLGAIERHSLALREARRLGGELIASKTAVPDKPINVELY